MILDAWCVRRRAGNKFFLEGDVYVHPKYEYGDTVKTPVIISLVAEDDRIQFQTKNSTYECFYIDFVTGFYDELEDVVRALGTEKDLSVIQNYFEGKVTFLV